MSWECSSCGFSNNDDAENCMCGFTNPIYPTSSTGTVENNLVVILSHKTSGYWFRLIFVIALVMYALFGAVIPVLLNGDFNAVLPASTRTGRSAVIFFGSMVLLAGIPDIFRGISSVGELCFYKDRLEIRALLFNRIKSYNYKDIVASNHGSYRVTIHKRDLPGWKSPFKQLKALCIDGASFALSPSEYKDPSNLPLVLNILKGSTEFREKAIS